MQPGNNLAAGMGLRRKHSTIPPRKAHPQSRAGGWLHDRSPDLGREAPALPDPHGKTHSGHTQAEGLAACRTRDGRTRTHFCTSRRQRPFPSGPPPRARSRVVLVLPCLCCFRSGLRLASPGWWSCHKPCLLLHIKPRPCVDRVGPGGMALPDGSSQSLTRAFPHISTFSAHCPPTPRFLAVRRPLEEQSS